MQLKEPFRTLYTSLALTSLFTIVYLHLCLPHLSKRSSGAGCVSLIDQFLSPVCFKLLEDKEPILQISMVPEWWSDITSLWKCGYGWGQGRLRAEWEKTELKEPKQGMVWSRRQTWGQWMGILGWCHISWKWHKKAVTRKKPVSLTAKVTVFHNK